MPTRSGWALLLTSAATIASGRLFGLLEAHVLGTVGLTLLLLSLLTVRLRPLPRIERRIHPRRPTAGEGVTVSLTLRNPRRRPTAATTIDQPIGERGGFRAALAPIPGGGRRSSTHEVPTDRRGPVEFHALTVRRRDPLGLVEHRLVVGENSEILVLPRAERVHPDVGATAPIGDPADGGIRSPGAVETGDFSALRPYATGDDLRRVHWPSSARLDDLLIREDEPTGEDHLSVLVDTRPGRGDPDRFERIVSIAAGFVDLAAARGDRIRLTTLAGFDSGVVTARNRIGPLLEDLALLDRPDDDSLVPAHLAPGTIALTASVDHTLPDLLGDHIDVLALALDRSASGPEPDPRVTVLVDGRRLTPDRSRHGDSHREDARRVDAPRRDASGADAPQVDPPRGDASRGEARW